MKFFQKKRKILITVLGGLFLFFGIGILPRVSADGLMLPVIDRFVFETGQKAVIFFEDGKEDLVLSTSFRGNAEDFAWIIPTPSQPEVSKSTQLLFDQLDEITRPYYAPLPETADGWETKNLSEDTNRGVTILEEKTIDYYDISVIEANDKEALYNWLNDNGYYFPIEGRYIADEYIQKNWFFTAVKINDERFYRVIADQLFEGRATPLRLSFKTEKIVYPLKISQLSGMSDESQKDVYVDGKEGKALRLGNNQAIATDRVVEGFNPENGLIKFSLKKRNEEGIGPILGIYIPGKNYLREGVHIQNGMKNVFTFSIESEKWNESYSVNLGDDFKKNQWQSYQFVWEKNPTGEGFSVRFFIDDVERTLKQEYSIRKTLPFQELYPDGKASVSVGVNNQNFLERAEIERNPNDVSEFIPIKYGFGRIGEILIDELQINSDGKGIFQSNFNDNISFLLMSSGKEGRFRAYKQAVYSRATRPSAMNVLIYVFADGEYYIPGFETQFGDWMSKDDVVWLAKIDGEKPWIEPNKEKYFLTRLWRNMPLSGMTEDLYPEKVSDGEGAFLDQNDGLKKGLVTGLIGISILSILIMIFILGKNKREKTQ